MPRQRRPTRPVNITPQAERHTRAALVTYAFSRLPRRQLPIFAVYAYWVVQIADRGWISRDVLGRSGGAVVSVLSMVTGLLLSYRFSSAVTKWDQGKKVWVDVQTSVRDGIRMLAVPISGGTSHIPSSSSSLSSSSSPVDVGLTEEPQSTSSIPVERKESHSEVRLSAETRVNELAGVLVGFPLALQHLLLGTRPLPQPPLCDLLPASYLSSLKRTEARVRFAESHAGPSGSGSVPSAKTSSKRTDTDAKQRIDGDDDEWELAALRERAEEAAAHIADAFGGESDIELKQQFAQLNIPEKTNEIAPVNNSIPANKKSNLHAPYPPNLPLSLLRLMEAYIVGLGELASNHGGWSEAQRERALGIVKALNLQLGEAERLSSAPPPLPLTLHLSHLLNIYLIALPCSLLSVLSGWHIVMVTVLAAWCLLGLDVLVGEVGGVFGSSENHQPLGRFTLQILNESLDASPSLARYYRARLVARVGGTSSEVVELDRRNRRNDEWLPEF